MNQHNPFVCIIDDEPLIRESLRDLLRSAGLKVQTFASAQEFLTSQPSETPGCLLLDVRMPGISGLELQRQLCSGGSPVPIIFMTGYGNIPMSVRAMKAGAFEFLTKPCPDEDLLSVVNQAIERGSRTGESNSESDEDRSVLNDELRNKTSFSGIVGDSEALRQVLHQVEIVAPNDATVLVLGETGTGKS